MAIDLPDELSRALKYRIIPPIEQSDSLIPQDAVPRGVSYGLMFNGSPTIVQHDPAHSSQTGTEPAGQAGKAEQAGQTGQTGQADGALLACPPFVAVSAALRRLLLQAEIAVPRLQCATLEGEAGTGKHLLAQNLHRLSPLAKLPFRRRDAREWLASEADVSTLTGTLYLDRVDLLSAPAQSLLLSLVKVLQNTEFSKGSLAEPAKLNRFLLLVSSHLSLRQLAAQGSFLPDLAFRLTAARFPLPPLREHREDIAPIAQTLIDRICRRYQQPVAVLASGSLPKLLQHSWPGNVCELASVLESAILDSTTGVLRPADFAFAAEPLPAPATLPLAQTAAESASQPYLPQDLSLDRMIRRHIQLVLDLNRGNKLRAARQLGISRSTLYRLLSGETLAGNSLAEESLPGSTLSSAF